MKNILQAQPSPERRKQPKQSPEMMVIVHRNDKLVSADRLFQNAAAAEDPSTKLIFIEENPTLGFADPDAVIQDDRIQRNENIARQIDAIYNGKHIEEESDSVAL